MSQKAVREITQKLPTLRDHWVAVDSTPSEAARPQLAALESGAIVVDADEELDALCARIAATGQTSLTILYAGDR